MRRELEGSADLQPLILDLNFWHRSFLTTIIVDHYPLFEFPCDYVFCAAKLKMFMFIIIIIINVCIKASALCYVALAPPPRHQHLRCFHQSDFNFDTKMCHKIIIIYYYFGSIILSCMTDCLLFLQSIFKTEPT